MAESKFCAGCFRGDESNTGEAWCCDCAELVCKTCSSFHKKLSPPHKIVSTEKVSSLRSSLLTISRHCEIHNDQKIVLFCCQHDQLICGSCVSESHQNCKSFMSMEMAAKGLQQGTGVTNLEKRINNLTQTMQKITNIYSTQISSLDERTKDFKKKVGDIRKKIISYLDKLETDFNKEIDSKFKECSETLLKKKSDIQRRYDTLTTWRKDMKSLKHYTSNIQLFHVIKYLDAKTHREETEFRNFKTNATIPMLNFRPAEQMSNIRDILPSFGALSIDNSTIPTSPDLDIDQQGQAFFSSDVPKGQISLIHSFETSVLGDRGMILRGCFVPNNKLLLNDYFGTVYLCDHDGSNIKTITMNNKAVGVTLYDRNTALVSEGDKGFQIIDMKTHKPGKQIKVRGGCYPITCLNGRIGVTNNYCTLTMIYIDGKVQKKVRTSFDADEICLTKDGDIYCIDCNSNVYVVTADGEERVVYSSFDLRGTRGITVDDHGDVYVAGRDSNNILRISSDGQQSHSILTKEDGIILPCGLSFNHQTKELMVLNNRGACINIYKVP